MNIDNRARNDVLCQNRSNVKTRLATKQASQIIQETRLMKMLLRIEKKIKHLSDIIDDHLKQLLINYQLLETIAKTRPTT